MYFFIRWVGRLSEMYTVMLRGVGAGLVSSSCISGPEEPVRKRHRTSPLAASRPDVGHPGSLAGPASGARAAIGRPKGESQRESTPPAGLEPHAAVSRPGLL